MLEIEKERAVLFTDLDGTLLDADSYQPSPQAVGMVARLAERGIVTVPVTSKTAPEVRRLGGMAAIAPVAVVEGGAVLLRPEGGAVALGPPRERLVELLERMRRKGFPVRGLSEMELEEVGERTGLDPDAARRAGDRLASEPFVMLEEQPESRIGLLRDWLAGLGFSLARGDRFWHLAGEGVDKGRGVQAVFDSYPHLAAVPAGAVGDAWNDLPMLCRVPHRYLLGDLVGDAELSCTVERIAAPGPGGFVEACRRFLEAVEKG